MFKFMLLYGHILAQPMISMYSLVQHSAGDKNSKMLHLSLK